MLPGVKQCCRGGTVAACKHLLLNGRVDATDLLEPNAGVTWLQHRREASEACMYTKYLHRAIQMNVCII